MHAAAAVGAGQASTKPHEPKPKGKTYGKLPNGVLFVKFANDGRLYTVGRDNALRTWTSEGKKEGVLENLPALPTRVACNFDDKFVLIGDLHGGLHYSNGTSFERLLK